MKISHGGSNRDLAWWVPGCLVRLTWLCLTGRAEHVLCGDALMNALCAPALKIFQVPSATMIHGLDITYGNRLYSAVVIPQLRRAAVVIANSTATSRRAVEFGVPENRLAVLRLGIEPPPAGRPGRQEARVALRRRFGLADDAVMLLTLGRLVPRKGVRWFTKSVLPQLDEDVQYLIAGQGPEEASITAAAKTAGVAKRVHLLGLVTDQLREELMAGADIFVASNIPVPGDIEGFGLVAVEAATRDTIVVAADLEGLKDAVIDGHTGILLPPGDARAWTSRLAGLLADRGKLASLGDQFGKKARDIYSEEAMGQALCALLGIGPARA
ncbi:MAG: glycosyltransferase family 4 protein [Actinobacteria bacterium]|nr:glycosyltransferase family 4 protein [Actinomycetota bacterium]